jgi:hypothetical protein
MWWAAKERPRPSIGELQLAAATGQQAAASAFFCSGYNPAQNAGWGSALGGAQLVAPQVPERILGRCRRHAPTMNGFPAAWSDDWCGDHKLDETKL